jgi:hypothetical protein
VKQAKTPAQTSTNNEQLLDELQRRAVFYFWETADPGTGLVNDRANNFESDDYTAASTAATGYGLAALAIGVEHGWLDRRKRPLAQNNPSFLAHYTAPARLDVSFH